ncbi:type II secretion system protein [Oceanimonas sp. CHS3-5]|uniref:type II secretion system protein n=1 Tax=Oceanimonas sp. CHS3-5 TaxID=3068186 RepID=UPI00273FBAA6|nr:type II secretion system protein [Oceanimonas sp. CHS3-5]MDP5291769.1 type II secretion system protein [Oceanimonas sp. CHS3-5]
MKRAAGFTLIELVIVIVILGILGAVAAPRFINLQDDAYGANVNALKGSFNSAMTLGSTKAVLAGVDQESDESVDVDGIGNVKFEYGFPEASKDGILKLIDLTENTDYAVVTTESNTEVSYNVIISGDVTPPTLQIFPSARFSKRDTCGLTYTEASGAGSTAGVAATTSDC